MRNLAILLLILFPMQTSTVTESAVFHTIPKPILAFGKKDIDCLAHNIYHEARGESIKGQIAVAAVTINRLLAQGYPSSICKVVYQPYQFSWVKLLKNHYPKNKSQYQVAHAIATNYLQGRLKDPTKGSLFYHANYVLPKWSKKLTHTVTIGNHLFYV
jgi:spore germination cell wall hydrolase CwlJ-like protein